MTADVTGTLTIDATDGAVTADLSTAERWHVLVLNAGRPVSRVEIASPGRTTGQALHTAAILRWADWEATRDELVHHLRGRLGMTEVRPVAPLDCSVVVCTHRRPDDLRRLLAGLRELDPAPLEIVIVDNDPGDADCESEVLAAGARYVREDRRGLNNARNAGVAAARAAVVAFIDDDCVPSRGWLRRLPEELANPAVAGVTGPAFPHALDTPARRRMEHQASLARGLRRVEFDWLSTPVAGAGAIGVGANMAFRTELLRSLGPRPFPPELDAGTATESGGDTYVMAKLLALGHRLVYDPATFVYHRHRQDGRALHRALFGYGVGLGAALTKLTVEDRELSAPGTWLWLLTQYRKTQQRRLAGFADAIETRLAWDYVRGGLRGPLRWRRALREVGEPPSAPQPSAPPPPPADAPDPLARDASTMLAGSAPSELAVIVPTSDRPASLNRCLDALACQNIAPERFEVVVVDDSTRVQAQLDPRHVARLRLRLVRTAGSGAAAARNAGARAAAAPLLLFLDDDVVAEPGLARAHLARHEREGADAVVVGPYAPRPVEASLAASAAALWWQDFFYALERADGQTYLGALTGNMSIAAGTFARSGGFDERFGRTRREDWEWGFRALRAGLALRYEPTAAAHHEFSLDAAGRLRAADLEGRGDALMLQTHPGASSAMLPLVSGALDAGGRTRALQRVVWRSGLVRRGTLGALAVLEHARLRGPWVRVFNVAQRLSYLHGVLETSPTAPRAEEPFLDLDLDDDVPIPPPSLVPPTVRVRVGGEVVAQVRPALGQWTPDLAEQLVDAVPWRLVDVAAAACGFRPERSEAHEHIGRVHVLLGAPEADAESGLVAAGAAVTVVEAGQDWRWNAVEHSPRGRDLVAILMPGVRPSRPWLEEALVAFDGERVGAVLGCGLADAAPRAPLVLHGRGATATDVRHDGVTRPWYAILRRELLDASAGELGALDPLVRLHALVERALDEGWVVGYRDVHGLTGEGPGNYAGARALAAVKVLRARVPVSAVNAELRRTTFVVARELARGDDRGGAMRSYAGTLVGLQRIWRRRGGALS